MENEVFITEFKPKALQIHFKKFSLPISTKLGLSNPKQNI